MIVATTDNVRDFEIQETLGLVRGSTVRSRSVKTDIVATIKFFLGGEIEEYTRLMGQAREQALHRMVEQAEAKGADAVINMKFATCLVMLRTAEFLAYGTAVKLNERTPIKRQATTAD